MNITRILILSFFISNLSYGQITVHRNFNLELAEKDSVKSKKLEKSLNAFLTQAQNGTYSEQYVDSNHLKKYEFFFNKLSGIGKNSTNFHNPAILKSYTPDGDTYMITVSFSGIKNDVPFIYQITELKAIPHLDHYRFYCPFEENTTHFKNKTFKNVTYYYSGSINEKKATNFATFKDELSQLTKTPKSNLDYYCFKNLDELLKSYGFLYSARQCNFLCYDLGFSDNGGKLYLTGTNNENYIFGYIGDYLYYNLPNKENMYWPFVQGVSAYYGGYGLSYDSLKELKQQFRNAVDQNPNINFLEEFKKGRKSSVNRHFSFYVMSAFLCEEVIRKQGFEDVIKLIYSGNNGELFFKNLKKILNVDETNFHDTIIRLINSK